MKKLIFEICLVFCLALSSYVQAGMVIGSGDGGGGCDSCAGDVILTWHAENSATVTDGTPCGCADTDETGTVNGTWSYSATASDGSYSMAPDSNGDYVAFSETIGSVATICAKVRATWSEFTDSTELFALYVDEENRCSIYPYGYDANTVDLRFRFEGQTDYEIRTISDIPVTDGQWQSVCVSFDVSQVGAADKIWFWLDGDADGVMDAAEYAETTTVDLSEFSSTSVEVRVGSGDSYTNGSADYLIDDFYIEGVYRNAAFVW